MPPDDNDELVENDLPGLESKISPGLAPDPPTEPAKTEPPPMVDSPDWVDAGLDNWFESVGGNAIFSLPAFIHLSMFEESAVSDRFPHPLKDLFAAVRTFHYLAEDVADPWRDLSREDKEHIRRWYEATFGAKPEASEPSEESDLLPEEELAAPNVKFNPVDAVPFSTDGPPSDAELPGVPDVPQSPEVGASEETTEDSVASAEEGLEYLLFEELPVVITARIQEQADADAGDLFLDDSDPAGLDAIQSRLAENNAGVDEAALFDQVDRDYSELDVVLNRRYERGWGVNASYIWIKANRWKAVTGGLVVTATLVAFGFLLSDGDTDTVAIAPEALVETTTTPTTEAVVVETEAPAAAVVSEVAASAFPSGWVFTATKTETVKPAPEFITATPIGAQLPWSVDVFESCTVDVCTYTSVVRPLIAETAAIPEATWVVNGPEWTLDVTWSSGVPECTIEDHWTYTFKVTEAEVIDGRSVATAFTGTWVQINKSDSCRGDSWELEDKWSLVGVAAG